MNHEGMIAKSAWSTQEDRVCDKPAEVTSTMCTIVETGVMAVQ